MSRAVPNQDSSPESFARLLNRLTHSQNSSSVTHDPALDPFSEPFADEAVRVSISRDGAAALSGSRKRAMAPVRQTRHAAEAGEISYEQALRLHSRPRAPELSELPPLMPLEDKSTRLPTPRSRAQAEAEALSALRQAKSHLPTARPLNSTPPRTETARSPFAAGPSSEPARPTAPNKKKQVDRSSKLPQTVRSTAKSIPPNSQKARKKRQSPTTSPVLQSNPSSTHPPAIGKTPLKDENRRPSRHAAPDERTISPSPIPRSSRVELEVASRNLALTQRQSIVSIRLNAIESDQLRQRAAESGISVSAYMRSCVLEAEHLRSQVKQALAELRTLHPMPAQPQLESPPLFASVYPPAEPPARIMRPGLFGFLSGIAAIFLDRFQR